MKLEQTLIEASSQGLDPILVFWADHAPGQGSVTVTCYGEAWTAFWGALGGRSVKKFFVGCDDDYLVQRLIGAQFQKRTKGHQIYLTRIVQAIKENLKGNNTVFSEAAKAHDTLKAHITDESDAYALEIMWQEIVALTAERERMN